jgi:hypothetical protein
MRTPALALLVLGTAGFGLGVLAALSLLLFSPMMFDAPGSERSIYPWLILASLALYPVLTLVGLTTAWRAFLRGEHPAALRRLLAPLLAAGLVFAAFTALEVACAGEFACGGAPP